MWEKVLARVLMSPTFRSVLYPSSSFNEVEPIFQRCQNMLLSFQTDLGSISSEIMALQKQSVQMNLQLQNRQAVRGELSQFVGDMVVPEHMIT